MPCKSDQIRFNNREEISQLPSDRVVRDGISMVPEDRRLFRSLSVEETLKVGAFAGRKGRWWSAQLLRLSLRAGNSE